MNNYNHYIFKNVRLFIYQITIVIWLKTKQNKIKQSNITRNIHSLVNWHAQFFYLDRHAVWGFNEGVIHIPHDHVLFILNALQHSDCEDEYNDDRQSNDAKRD